MGFVVSRHEIMGDENRNQNKRLEKLYFQKQYQHNYQNNNISIMSENQGAVFPLSALKKIVLIWYHFTTRSMSVFNHN